MPALPWGFARFYPMKAQTCSTSFADRVESLQMPVLIVVGRCDAFFPQEAVARLARNLPLRARDLARVQPRGTHGATARANAPWTIFASVRIPLYAACNVNS